MGLDGGRVGGLAEHHRDGLGGLPLDLGVPQHHPVVLGEFGVGLHHHALVGQRHRPGVGTRIGQIEVHHGGRAVREQAEVVHELLAPLAAGPGRRDVPDRGQQIGADGELRSLARPQRLQGAGEHLAREVLGGEAVPAAGPGVAAHRIHVPAVDLLVRGVVAGPDERGQLRV